MDEEIRTGRRDLIARVATLELLVSDLIGILQAIDPDAMQLLAQVAARDADIQNTRTLQVAEHQRERLYGVLQDRRRKLQPRRKGMSLREEIIDA